MAGTSSVEKQTAQRMTRLFHCVKCRSDQDTIMVVEQGNTVIIRCDACLARWTVTVLD